MGVLFDRGGTGLTSQGDPMAMEELALLLSAMGGQGGGISNMMRGLFARKAMKNRSSSRTRLAGEGQDEFFGGPPTQPNVNAGKVPFGPQTEGMDLASLLANIPQMQQRPAAGGGPGGAATPAPFPQAGAGAIGSPLTQPPVPPIPQSRTSSPVRPGSPGVLGGNVRDSSTKSLGAVAGEGAIPSASQNFSASLSKVWTPQRLSGLKKMIASQDPTLTKFAGNIMESLSATADPSKRHITAGKNIFDTWTATWVPQPPEDIFKPYDLSAGEEHHIPYFNFETGTYEEFVVKNDKGYDTQILESADHVDNDGKQWYRYMLVSKNPQDPTANVITDENGKVLLTDNASRVVTEEGISKTSKAKLWDHYVQLGHSAQMMEFLETQLPHLEEALGIGRVKMFFQSVKAFFNKLSSDEFEDYSNKVGAVGVAWDVANKYIKAITGAQMSEREATRLLKAIPNPRDNFAEFQSKLKVVREVIAMSTEYYHGLLMNEKLTVEEIKDQAQAYTARLIDKREASGDLQEVKGNILVVPDEYDSEKYESDYGYKAR